MADPVPAKAERPASLAATGSNWQEAVPPGAVTAAAEAIGAAMITRQSTKAIALAALEAAAPHILARASTVLKAEIADEVTAICAETVIEAVTAERERLAAVISPARFRELAGWFDDDDEFKAVIFRTAPGPWPEGWRSRSHELQDDLRRFADLLTGEKP